MENKILEEMANEYQESWLRGYCNGTNAIKIKHAFKDGYKAGFDAAKKEETDVVKVMPRWISVKERLPEKDRDVLWYNPTLFKPMDVDPISPLWNGCLEHNTYTHWMPLPEPPKEEKDAK